MSLSIYWKRLKYLDDLISRRATGNPVSLAKKLQLSRSHTIRILSEMKEAGFPIEYSKESDSYYYTESGRLVKNLFSQDLNIEEMKRISGGKSFSRIFSESHYMRPWLHSFVL